MERKTSPACGCNEDGETLTDVFGCFLENLNITVNDKTISQKYQAVSEIKINDKSWLKL